MTFFIFLVFCPKWEAWPTAPGFAHRFPGCSSSPGHWLCHCRRYCGIFKWRILMWKQRTSLGCHYKTFLPESSQTKGNNDAGKQFKEGSEAGHWRSRKRYTLTKLAFEEVSNILIANSEIFVLVRLDTLKKFVYSVFKTE